MMMVTVGGFRAVQRSEKLNTPCPSYAFPSRPTDPPQLTLNVYHHGDIVRAL